MFLPILSLETRVKDKCLSILDPLPFAVSVHI